MYQKLLNKVHTPRSTVFNIINLTYDHGECRKNYQEQIQGRGAEVPPRSNFVSLALLV